MSVKRAVIVALASIMVVGHAEAKQVNRGGSFSTSGGTGTFQRAVVRENGNRSINTTVNGAKGKSLSFAREGNFTKNENGSFSYKGSVTGPKGNSVNVDRSIVKNADGSFGVQSAYTGKDGQTLTTNRQLVKTDGGLQSTGNYSTSAGKTGTFSSNASAENGALNINRSITNQDGKGVSQATQLAKTEDGLERTVTNTNVNGQTKTSTQTINPDAQ